MSRPTAQRVTKTSVQDVSDYLEKKAPSDFAEKWDNVGLLLGDPLQSVKKILVGIDLTEAMINSAIKKKINLIINHHPCIFRDGMFSVTPEPKKGSLHPLIFQALEKKIAVMACHTNFDRGALDAVRVVSRKLGISPKGRLLDLGQMTDLRYQKNQYRVQKGSGYGFWGDVKERMSFSELMQCVKSGFDTHSFLVTGDEPKKVRRVAFSQGKGASFVESAHQMGCQVFVTGEVGYHVAIDAAKKGLTVVELGHQQSELYFLHVMKNWLIARGLEVEVFSVREQKFWH